MGDHNDSFFLGPWKVAMVRTQQFKVSGIWFLVNNLKDFDNIGCGFVLEVL